MNLNRYIDQRDSNGLLTNLALAVDALEGNGCDCGPDEPGMCLACLCTAALKELLEQHENTVDLHRQIAKLTCTLNHMTEKLARIALLPLGQEIRDVLYEQLPLDNHSVPAKGVK